jgi:hypothetical protein
MQSLPLSRTRFEVGDQKNHCIFDETSAGTVTERNSSKDRVDRNVSFEGNRVATHSPLGLGIECSDAIKVSTHVASTDHTYTSVSWRSAFCPMFAVPFVVA